MKKIIIFSVVTFLNMQLSAMEIEAQTKLFSERTPLKKDIQLILHRETKNILAIGAYMKRLPQDVNAIIYREFFRSNKSELDEKYIKRIVKWCPEVFLRHFLLEIRPLALGNKKFGIVDVLQLPEQKMADLMQLAEPLLPFRLYGIGNTVIQGNYNVLFFQGPQDFEKLRTMPQHITKDLEISLIGNRTAHISTCTRCLGISCVGIGLLIGCVGACGACTCGSTIPCMSPQATSVMMHIMFGLMGTPAVCECINCMQYNCCPQYVKYTFLQDVNDK